MANLTAAQVNLGFGRAKTRSYVVANSTTLYAGSLVAINTSGFLVKLADTSGFRPVGILQQTVTGDTTATPPVEGIVDVSGVTLQNVAIAGTFVQGDVRSLIYCSTDNPADCTKTAATNIKAIGYATRFRSAGFGDVTLFTPEEQYGLN